MTIFSGILVMEVLFRGSKSEGVYPVLRTSGGLRYRIQCFGGFTDAAEALREFEGQEVELSGTIYNKRGSLSIIIDLSESAHPSDVKSQPFGDKLRLKGESLSMESKSRLVRKLSQ